MSTGRNGPAAAHPHGVGFRENFRARVNEFGEDGAAVIVDGVANGDIPAGNGGGHGVGFPLEAGQE